MGGAMGGAISLRRCSSFDAPPTAPPPDRAAWSTSFAVARLIAHLKDRSCAGVGPRGEGTPSMTRGGSMTTSVLLVGRSIDEHDAPWLHDEARIIAR